MPGPGKAGAPGGPQPPRAVAVAAAETATATGHKRPRAAMTPSAAAGEEVTRVTEAKRAHVAGDGDRGDTTTQACEQLSHLLAHGTASKPTDLEIDRPLLPSHFATATHTLPSRGRDAGGVAEGSTSLADHIRACYPGLKQALKVGGHGKGQPLVLVVCPSARRCAALLKPLAAFGVRVEKLFAKHMDVEEQVANLNRFVSPIAVGTPNRLAKVAEAGALKLDACALVVLDVHPDSKQFTLLSQPQVRDDTISLLRHHIYPWLVGMGTPTLVPAAGGAGDGGAATVKRPLRLSLY